MYKKLSVFMVGTALVMSLWTIRAIAGQPASPDSATQHLPKPIATMQKRGVFTVVKRFDAPAGLTGYVLKEGMRYLVVYSRGDYVLSGALIGPDNHDLTAKYYAQYVPKPEYSNVVKHLGQRGSLITLGKNKAAPLLYVFEDPNCIFCYRLNKLLLPLVDQGKVQVKIVLVAFLKPDSLARATAILAASDPGEAIRKNEARYVTSREEGGYPAPKRPVRKFVAAVQANRNLMDEAGFSGTPAIIYRAKHGQWNGIRGMPSPAVLNKIIADDSDAAK